MRATIGIAPTRTVYCLQEKDDVWDFYIIEIREETDICVVPSELRWYVIGAIDQMDEHMT